MSAYMQMGHDTENLVGENSLKLFKGIVLSPVNRSPAELSANVGKFREKGEYDIILDPQLYFPRTKREKLAKQPYFPKDIDSTADFTSKSWWNDINKKLIKFADKIDVDKIASPVILPKVFDEGYYEVCAETCFNLNNKLSDTNIETLCSVMVFMSQLTKDENVFKISSILSEIDSVGYYIIFVTNVEPRREFSESDELTGAMHLIKLLKDTGREVLVSHTSSDMILFKAAGASSCASGKFFNLRRFTISRFEEPSKKGGGQLEYWFEQSLFAFLRKGDILRLLDNDFEYLIGHKFSDNTWSKVILEKFGNNPTAPWLKESWRQYLCWFAETENFLSKNDAMVSVREWLLNSEKNWDALENDDLLFEERKNNGSWLRSWRQALRDFRKKIR